LYGVRVGTLREDARRVRTGNAARIAAALRNAALYLLRGVAKRKRQGIADVTPEFGFDVPKAFKLVATRRGE